MSEKVFKIEGNAIPGLITLCEIFGDEEAKKEFLNIKDEEWQKMFEQEQMRKIRSLKRSLKRTKADFIMM